MTTSSGKDALSMVKRNSEILSSLTQGRAPPPKNRRKPSLKKRNNTSESFTSEHDFDKVHCLFGPSTNMKFKQRRLSTGSGLIALLIRDFLHMFGQVVTIPLNPEIKI